MTETASGFLIGPSPSVERRRGQNARAARSSEPGIATGRVPTFRSFLAGLAAAEEKASPINERN